MSLYSVRNKKIIITGATGVLGKKMAEHLAAEGAHTIILGRTESKINALVTEIKKNGGSAFGVSADRKSVV